MSLNFPLQLIRPSSSGPVGTDTILYDVGDNPIPASIINGDIPNDHYSFGSNGASAGVRVEFGSSCTSIGDYAFGGGNFSLNGPMVIGDGVNNSITTIGSAAFYYCGALTGPVIIGSTVTIIGSSAFAYNVPLTELYVDTPSSSWIGTFALGNNTGTSMVVYVSPTYFGVGSNYDSSWRSSQGVAGGVTIENWDNYPVATPNTNQAPNQAPIISSIGTQTNDDSDVVSLQVSATDPENDNLTYSSTGLPTGLSINSSTGLISGTIDAAASASSPYTVTITATDDGSPVESSNEVFTWNVSAVVVGGTDTILYDAGDNLITSISTDIPANWNDNGTPFTSATRVEIGTSCTVIGSESFMFSNALTGSLTIPNSVTSIGSYAFFACPNITSPLVLPDSVMSIGGNAFGNLPNVPNTVLELPDSAVAVSSSAFAYMPVIEVVAVNTATSLAGYPFYGCSNLTTAYLAPSFANVTSQAFFLTSLSTVYAKDAVANGWTLGAGQNILGRSNVTVLNWDNYPNPIPN